MGCCWSNERDTEERGLCSSPQSSSSPRSSASIQSEQNYGPDRTIQVAIQPNKIDTTQQTIDHGNGNRIKYLVEHVTPSYRDEVHHDIVNEIILPEGPDTTIFLYEVLPKLLVKNKTFLNGALPTFSIPTVQYTAASTQEKQKILEMITNKRKFTLDSIVKVKNPLLRAAYDLKKEEKSRFDPKPEERWLFHGTKATNYQSICEKNFDWRRTGSNIGHRFGRGVSFSPNFNYASNYSDRDRHDRIMIVALVLISKSCVGYANMVVPPLDCDTSHKPNDLVVVKYDDSEYFPAFLIKYHLS